MKTVYVPIPSYPWPHVVGPIITFPEEERWFDEDYDFLGAEAQRKYKQQRLFSFVTNMSPTTTEMEQMRPILRYGYYITIMDDYVGMMPLDELKAFRDRVFEVMVEEDPKLHEVGILRQMATARKEWLANGVPRFWIERMAREYYEYITYGIMEETPFKISNTFPSLGRFLLIRKYCIGQIAYVNLIEPATNQFLPEHIFEHPAMQRIRELQSLIIAIQNDFASIRKELASNNEPFNIILLLRHENKVSLEEAIVESLRIHDEMVMELDSITSCLPDFGSYQEAVENYVYHVKLMITGLSDFYYESGTKRYVLDGFASPKYATTFVERDLDIEIVFVTQKSK